MKNSPENIIKNGVVDFVQTPKTNIEFLDYPWVLTAREVK